VASNSSSLVTIFASRLHRVARPLPVLLLPSSLFHDFFPPSGPLSKTASPAPVFPRRRAFQATSFRLPSDPPPARPWPPLRIYDFSTPPSGFPRLAVANAVGRFLCQFSLSLSFHGLRHAARPSTTPLLAFPLSLLPQLPDWTLPPPFDYPSRFISLFPPPSFCFSPCTMKALDRPALLFHRSCLVSLCPPCIPRDLYPGLRTPAFSRTPPFWIHLKITLILCGPYLRDQSPTYSSFLLLSFSFSSPNF